MQLTNTKENASLRYDLPDLQHVVEVHLPGSQAVSDLLSSGSRNRILQIPVHSAWSPGAHWHETFVEHIRILKGHAKVWINGKCRHLGPDDEATFELFDIHDFSRADVDTGEDLFIEEWVDNDDGSKEMFFRNAFSIVKDVDKFGGLLWAFLRFFYLCSYRDNFIAFLPIWAPAICQRMANKLIFGIIKGIGMVAGWTDSYDEYTPQLLREHVKISQKGKQH